MENEKKGTFGIRITSDPDVTRVDREPEGDVARQVDLPLRLLVASNLTPGRATTGILEVDASRLAPLLEELAPRLEFEVENRIGREPRLLDVSLEFRTLSDFEPAGIARQVPIIQALLNAHQAAREVADGDLDVREFVRRLEKSGLTEDWSRRLRRQVQPDPEAPSPPAERGRTRPASEDALDRLFDLVDSGDADLEPFSPAQLLDTEESFAESIVGAIAGSASRRAEQPAAATAASDLAEVISGQLDAIFNHNAFRELEAAWRGLRFLVRHLDFRQNVRLEVLPVSKEDLDDALYQHVLLPEHQRNAKKPPLSAVVLDFAFESSHRDLAALGDLAETGASLQVPVLASAAPAFFGVATAAGLEQLPPLRQHLSGPVHIGWHKLRQRDEARFLALTIPPFLLRAPYGPDNPARGIDFTETGFLWSGGTLLVAAIMGASFVAHGWPTRISGADARIDGLPLRQDTRGAVPLGAMLTHERMLDFAEAGFVVLGCRINRDGVYLASAPTVAVVDSSGDGGWEDEARVDVSLASSLFASRAAAFLLTLRDELADEPDVRAAREQLGKRLRGILSHGGSVLPEDAVSIETTGDAGVLAVRLHPPPSIVDGPVRLVMGFPLSGQS